MKRMNLVLDERILEETRQVLGLKTWSEVVNLALKELLRQTTFARIDAYARSGIWEGDLGQTRGDGIAPG